MRGHRHRHLITCLIVAASATIPIAGMPRGIHPHPHHGLSGENRQAGGGHHSRCRSRPGGLAGGGPDILFFGAPALGFMLAEMASRVLGAHGVRPAPSSSRPGGSV
jgi:hypothetical protein